MSKWDRNGKPLIHIHKKSKWSLERWGGSESVTQCGTKFYTSVQKSFKTHSAPVQFVSHFFLGVKDARGSVKRQFSSTAEVNEREESQLHPCSEPLWLVLGTARFISEHGRTNWVVLLQWWPSASVNKSNANQQNAIQPSERVRKYSYFLVGSFYSKRLVDLIQLTPLWALMTAIPVRHIFR